MEAEAMPQPHTSAACILVVDDSVEARLPLSSLLRVMGYTVYEAADAAQALIVLGSSLPVDALITDVDMPGPINGLALAELVRSERPGIAVVVVSGRDHAARVKDPAVLFLRKPYDANRLLHFLVERTRAV